jgi:uncharacterized 2Fe-2S/4Fe-4S cluster protein (DUF4445 family)
MTSGHNREYVTLYIPSYNRKLSVYFRSSIAEALRTAGITLETPCGGHGLCGGCLIKIIHGEAEILDSDRELIPEELLNEGYRLACRKRILNNDITIDVPITKRKINLQAIPVRIKGKYGFAVDLGTTTIAVSLVNIDEGIEIGSLSVLNPQTAYGTDVITRATVIMEDPDALNILKKIVIETITFAFKKLLQECRVGEEDIVRISISGNSIMEHIFLGYSPVPLTVSPFHLSESIPGVMSAQKAGFFNFKNASVNVFPMIGANAGGDTVAGIFYLDMIDMTEPAILIDIGTNVEMVLAHDGELYATSSPAGPAFEGGEITFGMRAEEGAIESVEIQDFVLRFRVKGGGKPRGICGSGLISLVSELLKFGVIDRTGRIKNRDEIPDNLALRVQQGGRGNIFTLHRDTKVSLYITQNDVRQLQLAKSAIRAGVEILLKKAGMNSGDIRNVYMAGAFGVAIDEDAIFRIGMLPYGFRNKLIQAGDTSLGGAKRIILDENAESKLKEILDRTKYIELSKEKDFEMEFIKYMDFMEEKK